MFIYIYIPLLGKPLNYQGPFCVVLAWLLGLHGFTSFSWICLRILKATPYGSKHLLRKNFTSQILSNILKSYPRCSMYGLSTNICPKNHPNVGKYIIHGASGYPTDFLRHLDPKTINGTFFAAPAEADDCGGHHCSQSFRDHMAQLAARQHQLLRGWGTFFGPWDWLVNWRKVAQRIRNYHQISQPVT